MKYTDWRLPTVDELQTILDRTKYDPAIDTDFFPDTQASTYWSSTTYAYGPDYAWIVSFYNGNVNDNDKDNLNYVRAVRGGQCGSFGGSLIDNGDGTVTDTGTGLMWLQKTIGHCTWDKANKLIEKLNKVKA